MGQLKETTVGETQTHTPTHLPCLQTDNTGIFEHIPDYWQKDVGVGFFFNIYFCFFNVWSPHRRPPGAGGPPEGASSTAGGSQEDRLRGFLLSQSFPGHFSRLLRAPQSPKISSEPPGPLTAPQSPPNLLTAPQTRPPPPLLSPPAPASPLPDAARGKGRGAQAQAVAAV